MGSVVPFELSRLPKRQPAPLPRAAADIVILQVVQHVRPAPTEPRTSEPLPAQQPL